jgi:hypothetical protein
MVVMMNEIIQVKPSDGDGVVVKVPTQFTTPTMLLLLTALMAYVHKYILQPSVERFRSSLFYNLNAERELQLLCSRVLGKTGATRVLLYLPHNGETFPNGTHKWKVSARHEVVASKGDARLWRELQGIDTSHMTKTSNVMMNNHVVHYPADDIDSALSRIYQMAGVEHATIFGRRFGDAFFALDVHEPKKQGASIEEELAQMQYILERPNKPAILFLLDVLLKRSGTR